MAPRSSARLGFARASRRGLHAGLLHLSLLGFLFVLLPSLAVHAQMGHQHQWQPTDDVPVPTLNVETKNPSPGQIISVSVVKPNDTDLCENQGGEMGTPCPFPSNTAQNDVRIVTWSDGGGGGSFGYLDELGQFVPSSDPALVDHYQCPNNDAYLTLSVTVDDISQAVEPGTGNTVATYNDAPETGGCAIHVGGYPTHQHAWDPVDNMTAPSINMFPTTANAGDVVYVYWSPYPETDHCINYGCPINGGNAQNLIHGVGWNDGGAGGTFGYLDGNGQFVPTTDATRVTCYKCPPEGKAVEITVIVDDIPTATDPSTGETVATYDDQPITVHTSVRVREVHHHQWDPVNDLPQPRLQVGSAGAAPGQLVSVSADLAGLVDIDRCTNESCSFYSGMAFNQVQFTGWSDGGAGGSFGYLDGNGQFVSSTDPFLITHYQVSSGSSPGSVVTLSGSLDDVPQDTDPSTYQTIPTFDDAPVAAEVQLQIEAPAVHTHQWEAVHDLPTVQISAANSSPYAGDLVAVSASAGSDTDRCTNIGTGSGDACPFPDNTATNNVAITGWSDGGAGGSFGYLDQNGQFVVASDPTQVTHYQCPATGGTVQLEATMDDLPQAVEPGSGNVVATYDDQAVSGTLALSVTGTGSGHTHNWDPVNNLVAPSLLVEATSPAPGQVIALSVDYCFDIDHCGNPGCPFYMGYAENAVHVTGWSDGGAGGSFGYRDDTGQFVATTDPELVTSYQCPSSGSTVNVTVTIDDIPQAMEPGGALVTTYDDASATVAVALDVAAPEDHSHGWEQVSNLPAPVIQLGQAQAGSAYGAAAPRAAAGAAAGPVALASAGAFEAGSIVPVAISAYQDDDLCTDPDSLPCPFPNYLAYNPVVVTAWSDGGAGGSFGYLDQNGQFTVSIAPAEITHYRISPNAQSSVTLQVTVDDIPVAVEPPTGYAVPTYHDGPAYGSMMMPVRPPSGGGHQHQWDGNNLSAYGMWTETDTPQTGQVIRIDRGSGFDMDYCSNYGSPNPYYGYDNSCSFYGNMATNAVVTTSWSDGNAGGKFGWLDANGQFVERSQGGDWTQVDHYQCPTQTKTVTLSVTVDDIPEALNRFNTTESTFNDAPFTYSHQIKVQNGNGHVHQWSVGTALRRPSLRLSTPSASAGSVVGITCTPFSDQDTCTVTDPYCPFPANSASNQVVPIRWTDGNAGGSFGYLDGSGQFVASSDPKQVTSYRCPANVVGQKTVSLTVQTDDIPSAVEPGTGQVVGTWDDTPAQNTVPLTVTNSHTHDWEAGASIPTPTLSASQSTAAPGALIQLTKSVQDESDHCKNTGCSFSSNTAPNHVRIISWNSSGGGSFGYVIGSTFYTASSPEQVTSFRCPTVTQGTNITLTMTVDDDATALDPANNAQISTFNDTAATATCTLHVGPPHDHNWTSTGNTADAPVHLYYMNSDGTQGSEVPAGAFVSPCTVLILKHDALTQDTDTCTVTSPACSFAGTNNVATEDPGSNQLKNYADGDPQNAGSTAHHGRFGTVDSRGNFIQRDPSAVSTITHYQVPSDGGAAQVWLVVSDTGKATDPVTHQQIGTVKDADRKSSAASLNVDPSSCGSCSNVLDPDHRCTKVRRDVDAGQVCPLFSDRQPAFSEITPGTGALSFDVPVTQWASRGQDLGLTLSYNSDSMADPSLDSSLLPGMDPVPNFANLSTRNSHWTHNWAQFLEVVNSGGTQYAVWHHGDSTSSYKLKQVIDGPANVTPRRHQWLWFSHDKDSALTCSDEPKSTVMPTPGIVEGGGEVGWVPYSNFVVTGTDGTVYAFSQIFWQRAPGMAIPYFLLTGIKDRFGRTVTLTWVEQVVNGIRQPALTQVADDAQRTMRFQYKDRLLQQVTDPFNRTHTFEYSTYLSEFGRPEVKLTGVHVTGPGSPTSVRYDWKFAYGTSTNDLITYKREPTGKQVYYEYAPLTVTSPPRQYRSDWRGVLTRAFYQDASEGGRLKQITRASDGTLTYPEGDSYQYTYTAYTGELSQVKELSTGRTVNYRYDAWHQLTKMWTEKESESSPLVQIDYLYYDGTRPTPQYAAPLDSNADEATKERYRVVYKKTIKSPLTASKGDRTEITYDWASPAVGLYNLPQRAETGFRTATGAQGYNQVVEWQSRDVQGNPAFVYRGFRPFPGAGTGYQPLDSVKLENYVYGQPGKVTDSVGRVSGAVYNLSTGDLVQSLSPTNNAAIFNATDPNSSTAQIERYPDGMPLRVTDPMQHKTEYSYDAAGDGSYLKVTAKHLGDLKTSTVVLDAAGNPVSATDENGDQTSWTYNGDGLPLTCTEAVGVAGQQRTTRYEYDRDGNLTALVTPRGGRTTFEYVQYAFTSGSVPVLTGKWEGQVTHIVYPDGAEEYFSYDPQTGVLAQSMRPYRVSPTSLPDYSRIIWYSRDEVRRVTGIVYSPSPQGIALPSSSATYDEFGRVIQAADSTGSTQYVYDALDRLRQVLTSANGPQSAAMEYLPDLDNHRWITRTTLGGTKTWETQQDSKGRTSRVITPDGLAYTFYYDYDGKLLQRGNWMQSRLTSASYYEYDQTGRDWLAKITHKINGGQAVHDTLTYTHDPVGRILTETDGGSRVHRFGYDHLGQLISEQHPDLGAGGTQYYYDLNGNRSRVVRNGKTEYYNVDAADKLWWINTAGNNPPTPGQAADYTTYNYDSFGQMISRDRKQNGAYNSLQFQWDLDGRLRGVKKNNAYVFTATYDAGGQRVTKTDQQAQHTYSYGLYDTAGNTTTTPGLGQSSGPAGNRTHRSFLGDWQGSTRYLVNGEGTNVPSGLRYDAYGNTTRVGGNTADPTEFQYAGAFGYEREPSGGADLGLDYLEQRYYDRLAGRFISRDPIRWAGGVNLYAYCNNDPVNHTDSTGLDGGFDGMSDDSIQAIQRGNVANFRWVKKIAGDFFNWLTAGLREHERLHREHAPAQAIIDFTDFAKRTVTECDSRFGSESQEQLLEGLRRDGQAKVIDDFFCPNDASGKRLPGLPGTMKALDDFIQNPSVPSNLKEETLLRYLEVTRRAMAPDKLAKMSARAAEGTKQIQSKRAELVMRALYFIRTGRY